MVTSQSDSTLVLHLQWYGTCVVVLVKLCLPYIKSASLVALHLCCNAFLCLLFCFMQKLVMPTTSSWRQLTYNTIKHVSARLMLLLLPAKHAQQELEHQQSGVEAAHSTKHSD